jgi:hypothetical protein
MANPVDWGPLPATVGRPILAQENARLVSEVDRLRAAIRKHRDYRGDDRCWQDDEELYAVLPEGYTPPARDSAVELKNCERYIACRHNPATECVSPQRRIEELEQQVKDYDEQNAKLQRELAEALYKLHRIEREKDGGAWPEYTGPGQ